MIEVVTLLLFIILFARSSEELTKIPTTLFLIAYAYVATLLFPGFFTISKEEFNSLLYLMIPIILLPDLLKLSIMELKANILPILYLAVFSVVVSILIASFIAPFLIFSYEVKTIAFIALFTMLMATDAITVSSIFSNFNLPKRLKIYAEGESLLNDVTALVIFYFIALPILKGVDVTLHQVNFIIIKVVLLSSIIGILSAFIGFLGIRILKDPIEQFIIIYLVGIVSFLVAEHLHISGILSVITAIISFKIFIHKELKKNPNLLMEKYSKKEEEHYIDIYSIISDIKKFIPSITRREFRGYKKEASYIGIFANGVVFITIAHLFKLPLLQKYAYEILIVFILTTSIRFMFVYIMMKFLKKEIQWSISLTLSGVKGALAIIMVHSLPQSCIHKELFETIVVGNVILTTFIYTIVLIFYIDKNRAIFKRNMLERELKQSHIKNIKNLKEALEKDEVTTAYNRVFFDEILERELIRAIRYKLDLSIIAFRIKNFQLFNKETQDVVLKETSDIILQKISKNDYYGKYGDDYYLLLTTNTPLSGATILANRLEKKFTKKISELGIDSHFYFGITDTNDTDSIENLLEKIEDALNKARFKSGIEIAY